MPQRVPHTASAWQRPLFSPLFSVLLAGQREQQPPRAGSSGPAHSPAGGAPAGKAGGTAAASSPVPARAPGKRERRRGKSRARRLGSSPRLPPGCRTRSGASPAGHNLGAPCRPSRRTPPLLSRPGRWVAGWWWWRRRLLVTRFPNTRAARPGKWWGGPASDVRVTLRRCCG